MKRILVVDDESAIVDALQDILSSEGYEVDTAINGAEGLERLRAKRPDLVLLDLMMPVLDGLGMLERMRAELGPRGLPVVLMSAGRPPPEVKSSVDHFLEKPFHLDSLIDAVTKLLDGAEA